MEFGMCSFLSERAVCLHKEEIEKQKLKYSVLEISIPEIYGCELKDILKKRFSCKDELLSIKGEIICHGLFFASFGVPYQSSSAVRAGYRTEASFLYEVSQKAKNDGIKFLVISKNDGKVNVTPISDFREIFKIKNPTLSIDLCEHAYFLDYGFLRDEYITGLLPYLNLSYLDKI